MNELILATVEHLRAALSLPEKQVGEQPDGQPPPNAGQVYLAVHEGQWGNTADESLDEYCGILVTVTLKSNYAPADRKAQTVLQSLRNLRSRVRVAVHDNYELMNLANAKLVAAAGHLVNGFVEPLRFRDAGKPQEKGSDWFWSEVAEVSGVACTLVFERARRVQTLESME